MDPADIFRQGFGQVAPRQNPVFMGHPQHHMVQFQQQPPPPPAFRKPVQQTDETSDGDGSGHRIAHTLTACCRCRQRKTRCDPTLPRCLPCERSGSTCEYLDAAKGRKINRHYVIRLQDKVRQLEAELSQYTDDENEYPKSNEDMVRPGGMVRLNGGDETPRYLGPSSGIAMTRLLMEQAKRYTDSKRISDLIPSVRARQARMQSIQMTGPSARRKSYPMISQHPAESLPTRAVADKLLEIFNQKAQLFWPVLHEKDLLQDLDAVYNGDSDPYRLFIVRMLVAISLQKLDTQYAGLADSYYLAAMQLFEDVVRPKDLKTLQCLVLLGEYSLLTPTRTPIYYVIGLAARICQQEGLASEKTISTGYNLDAKTIDMRRRIIWTVAAMEYGLAHSMGRPNNFATGDDRLDVEFFAAVDDDNITDQGIQPGPPSERKLVAIHFYRMRMCQAEIRRALYEKKKEEPKNDSHPWFARIEKMNKEWLDASPTSPDWCKPWFTGRYHQMRIFMYRPSPQIPKPSPRAAAICYESAAYIIQLNAKQMGSGADLTWVFLLTVNMSLNTLLWTVSYPEVRQAHPRHEVENLVQTSMEVLDRCTERWPGTASASQLYSIFSKACLQGYDERPMTGQTAGFFTTPPSFADPNSPEAFQNLQQAQAPYQNPPQFNHVFNSPPEAMNAYAFDPNFPPPQPSFRSNSIFFNPASNEPTGRRFSYFPPDFMQPSETMIDDPTPPATTTPEQHMTSPPDHMSEQLPTPPDSIPTGNMATPTPSNTLSPSNTMTAHPTPIMQHASPAGVPLVPVQTNMSPPIKIEPSHRGPTFVVPQNPQAAPTQRPLPTPSGIGDWFSPPAPFISPYAFNNMSNSFFNDSMANPGNYGDMPGSGLGLQNIQGGNAPPQFDYGFARQGSLTQSQQLELMNVLETEGMGDIDAFLNGGNMSNNRWY
ncbi:fungal-specific transcription factor domain-containing protein [Fusarium redolens]|uniref:Fungal-specific transcription factor domain-containing protein n=1 Tax=Fusarium redolens TaxID=48865 RepID=A0A9P9R9I5_FUSRE|nr:fungal-specific transcription factor domain-containing protein [Fusarium redolens]KAH7270010.1 fungal-specific transcription factor domain-containing protein [Fusarium redolens]